MSTLVLVLFIVAWVAIAFAIVRALAIAWGFHQRLAAATAVAVAGAFALGMISPFALPSRSTPAPPAPAAAPAAPAAPVADSSHAVKCPAKATVAAKFTTGHLDAVGVGAAAPGSPPATLMVPAGSSIQLGGWIVLDSGPPAAICAIIDGHIVPATARYGITRPDVAAALGKPNDVQTGFLVTVHVPQGTHVVNVGAVQADGTTVNGIQGGALNVQAQ